LGNENVKAYVNAIYDIMADKKPSVSP
jgi:hypothetical protein